MMFDLYLVSQAALLGAFARVGAQSSVSSCTLESDRLRLQYVAPRDDAMALVERIYLDGGLRWCSSHGLRERAAGDFRERLGEESREGAKPEPGVF
jgi:hypothetical protein